MDRRAENPPATLLEEGPILLGSAMIISYKAGYKYQLHEDYLIETGILALGS